MSSALEKREAQDELHYVAIRAYYEYGDERLLEEPLRDMLPRLRSYIRGRLFIKDPDEVEDLAQETLAATLISLRKQLFEAGSPFGAWVCRLCYCRYADSQRDNSARPSRPGHDEDPFLLLSNQLATPADVRPITAESTERAAATLALVTKAVLALAPNDRACVLLRYYQRVPIPEAAERLGISTTKFKERLNRGLFVLRDWASHNRHLALKGDEYDALRGLNTKNLFSGDDAEHDRRQATKRREAQRRIERRELRTSPYSL